MIIIILQFIMMNKNEFYLIATPHVCVVRVIILFRIVNKYIIHNDKTRG